MNSIFALVSVVLAFLGKISGTPVRYDQRQEGDLNVRTDVEDVVLVVVPPQELVAAGMGLVAATAAELLKKNYGAIGPERWPLRTSSKLGFAPVEKSPYKIDLGKSGLQVKKISQQGDPNRYNFHENKNPSKAVPEMPKEPVVMMQENPTTDIAVEMEEMGSMATGNKTVKKELKPDEGKIEPVVTKVETNKMKLDSDKTNKSKSEMTEATGDKTKNQSGEIKAEELKVIGGANDPTSLLKHEGCGPDAFRDSSGKCVYITSFSSQI